MTDEICGLEHFATAAAIRALGDRLRGKKLVSFSDNDAGDGALAMASARVPFCLAMVGCFWALTARLSISRWVEKVPLGANAADAPSRGGLNFGTTDERGVSVAPAGVTGGPGSRRAGDVSR